MQAFYVNSGTRGVVVLADNHGQARKKARKPLEVVDAQIEVCKRLPWADHYLSEQNIPASEYLAHGISLQCPWCHTTITEVTNKTTASGPFMFCDRSCKATHDLRQEAIAAAIQKWFGIEIMSVNGIGHARQITFVFPGCRKYAVWNYGSGMIDICITDQATWNRWNRYCLRQQKKKKDCPCEEFSRPFTPHHVDSFSIPSEPVPI